MSWMQLSFIGDVSTGLSISLVSQGNKLLPEPLLTQVYKDIRCCHQATMLKCDMLII